MSKNKNCKHPTKAGRYDSDIEPTPGKYKKPENEPCDLQEMIFQYHQYHEQPLIHSFEVLETYTDFICGGPNIKEADVAEQFCKSVHQYLVPKDAVREAWGILTKQNFDDLQDFDSIYAKVRECTRKIDRYGELAMFDFAQRYAYSRKIYPAVVFLHAGVAIGVRALKKSGYKIKIYKDKPGCPRYVKLNDLPASIAALGTVHAENFLCINKDYLEKLKWD